MFKNANYPTAATATIQAMLDAEAKGENFMTNRAYKQALEALSLMNSVRDMQLSNDGMIYATANDTMYSWKLLDVEHDDIKAVNPDVVLLHTYDGKWTNMTHYFQ